MGGMCRWSCDAWVVPIASGKINDASVRFSITPAIVSRPFAEGRLPQASLLAFRWDAIGSFVCFSRHSLCFFSRSPLISEESKKSKKSKKKNACCNTICKEGYLLFTRFYAMSCYALHTLSPSYYLTKNGFLFVLAVMHSCVLSSRCEKNHLVWLLSTY